MYQAADRKNIMRQYPLYPLKWFLATCPSIIPKIRTFGMTLSSADGIEEAKIDFFGGGLGLSHLSHHAAIPENFQISLHKCTKPIDNRNYLD